MNRILIAYVSHSGSTEEIAEYICRELSSQGQRVDIRPACEIVDLSPYDVIIAAGLVYRFGWHPEIVKFLKINLAELRKKKVFLFAVGLRLVRTPDCDRQSFPVFIDPAIMKQPTEAEQKGLMDSITTMRFYLHTAWPSIEEIKPASLAFFAGKLDLHTLGVSEKIIMLLLMLLTGKKSGDYRNWDAITEWVNRFVMDDSTRREDHRLTTESLADNPFDGLDQNDGKGLIKTEAAKPC